MQHCDFSTLFKICLAPYTNFAISWNNRDATSNTTWKIACYLQHATPEHWLLGTFINHYLRINKTNYTGMNIEICQTFTIKRRLFTNSIKIEFVMYNL